MLTRVIGRCILGMTALLVACGPIHDPELGSVELKEVWKLTPNRCPRTYRARMGWIFSHLTETAYSLSSENGDKLTLVSDLRFEDESETTRNHGVLLEATDSKPYLLIPEIAGGRRDRVVGRVVITPPAKTTIVVYYKSAKQDYYLSPQRISAQIGPGKSVFFFDLTGVGHIGRIRLDPGRVPGLYHLHELTIRTE